MIYLYIADIKSLDDASRLKAVIATLEPYQDIVKKYNIENLKILPWGPESNEVKFSKTK